MCFWRQTKTIRANIYYLKNIQNELIVLKIITKYLEKKKTLNNNKSVWKHLNEYFYFNIYNIYSLIVAFLPSFNIHW